MQLVGFISSLIVFTFAVTTNVTLDMYRNNKIVPDALYFSVWVFALVTLILYVVYIIMTIASALYVVVNHKK